MCASPRYPFRFASPYFSSGSFLAHVLNMTCQVNRGTLSRQNCLTRVVIPSRFLPVSPRGIDCKFVVSLQIFNTMEVVFLPPRVTEIKARDQGLSPSERSEGTFAAHLVLHMAAAASTPKVCTPLSSIILLLIRRIFKCC